MIRKLILVATVAACLGGCGNFRAIHHSQGLYGDAALFVDAQQRAIITTTQPGAGNERRRLVCAEPSPDAMTVASASAAAQGQSDQFRAAVSAAMTESGGTIGVRTHSIQILRDSLYQMCQNYANGAFYDPVFVSAFRQYQQMLVGLVAIEQLTGVVRSPAVAFHAGATTASAHGNLIAEAEAFLAALESRRDAVDREIRRLTPPPPQPAAEGETPAPPAPEPPELVQLRAQKASLVEDIDQMRDTIREMYGRANTAVAAASATTGPGSASATPINAVQGAGSNLTNVAETVEDITRLIVGQGQCTGLASSAHKECMALYQRPAPASGATTEGQKTPAPAASPSPEDADRPR